MSEQQPKPQTRLERFLDVKNSPILNAIKSLRKDKFINDSNSDYFDNLFETMTQVESFRRGVDMEILKSQVKMIKSEPNFEKLTREECNSIISTILNKYNVSEGMQAILLKHIDSKQTVNRL
jgi:hypothetical protein